MSFFSFQDTKHETPPTVQPETSRDTRGDDRRSAGRGDVVVTQGLKKKKKKKFRCQADVVKLPTRRLPSARAARRVQRHRELPSGPPPAHRVSAELKPLTSLFHPAEAFGCEGSTC